jgi:DNA-binding beta-propeller fold protein YncE
MLSTGAMTIQSPVCSLTRCCTQATYLLAFAGLCLAGICLPNALFAAEPLPQEMVAIGTIGRNIVLERTDTDEVFAQIATHGIAPREIVPSADGRFLFAITEGRSLVEVIDIAGKKVIDTINLSSPGQSVKLFGLAVNPQGDQIFVNVICIDRARDSVRAEEPQIWAVDRTTHKVTKLLQSFLGVHLLIFSPTNARLLYAFGADIYVVDLDTRQIVKTLRFQSNQVPGAGSLSMSCSPLFDQTNVLSCPTQRTDPITQREFGGLLNFDLVTAEWDQMDLGPPVMWDSAVVSPDLTRAYAVWNELYVVDLAQRRVMTVKDLPMTEGSVTISRDGKKLYVSDGSPSILIFDANTLSPLKTIALPETTANCELRVIHPR